MKSFMAAVCVLVVTGCSNVLMKEPFPDSKLTEKEQAELTGQWQINDDVVSLAFTSNGVPWLAFVEWEADAFQLKQYRLHFTRQNDVLYLSMPAKPNGEAGGYYFAEIKLDGQTLLVWNPDDEVFKSLIEKGALKGTIDQGKHATEIALDTPAQNILELISTNATAFDYKNPILFRKLD